MPDEFQDDREESPLGRFKLAVERRFSRVEKWLAILTLLTLAPKLAGYDPSSLTTAAAHVVAHL